VFLDYSSLARFLRSASKASVFRVTFRDGEQFELRAIGIGQDQGRPPHADGLIVQRIVGKEGQDPGTALFFWLADVVEIQAVADGSVVYAAT